MRTRLFRFEMLVVPAALLAVSCGGSLVPLELDFPSTNSFILSQRVSIDIFPITSSELGQCPQMLREVMMGTRPTDAPGAVSIAHDIAVCDARRGVSVPDPGTGARVFIVQVFGATNVILSGCTVGEAFPGSPPIAVSLFPTSSYNAEAMAHPIPPGATVDQRCM